MDDILTQPATDVARMLRGRELSSRELTEAQLARIEAVNPGLNAVVELRGEQALAEAAAADDATTRGGQLGPLHGLPMTIKDSFDVAGLHTTWGNPAFRDHVASADATVVRRLRRAGAVVVGKTNVAFMLGDFGQTANELFGATANPWDPARTPGGSSGGAAAAVASGMLPVAHGNDGGGSLRIPASCCGLVGLKPSRGRVSRGPDLGDSFLASDGVLTRTVGETAQLLDVLAGYEVGDATWAPRPAEAYSHSVRRDPGRLRIAMTAENALNADVDPECLRGMHETGELLARLGHQIDEASPALPGKDTLRLFTGAFGPAIALQISYGELLAGRPPQEDEIEPLSRALADLARGMSSLEYLACIAQLQALARGVVAFFAEYDVLLTPALAERPLRIGECNGVGEDPMADFARSGQFTPYTALFNVTGQPAISVPAGVGEDGLPTNAHLVGKPLGEDTLLQVAAQLEAARSPGA
jgi:amidase